MNTMKKTQLDKTILVCLLVLNTLFLIYWSILAYYSQLHYDDLHFLWKMREMSVFEYVKEMYYTRSGRFVGYAINGVVSNITDLLGIHQFWAILYYILGLSICWLVIKDFKLNISRPTLFMGMCFVYNLYILTNIDFPVFFWHCAMSYYLFLPMACLLLKYLNMKKLNGWQWTALLIMAVLIGGGNEAFSPIVLLLMFVCGMYWWRSKGWKVKETWDVPQVRRIVWTAIFMLLLFAIVLIAPGNYERMSDTTQFVHPEGIVGWIMAISNAIIMFFYFMVFYIPYYSIAFSLAFYVGNKINLELPKSKMQLSVRIVFVFLVYLVVSALPNVYLYGGFGIQRSYTHIVFVFLLSVMAIGFILGINKKTIISGWCAVGGMALLSVIMCVNIIKDTPTARKYGKAVDERIEYLCELRDNGQKEAIEVQPLPIPYTEDPKHLILHLLGKETPRSVLYYYSETGTEPNEYEYHMKRVLNLDFDFVLPNNTQDIEIEERM